MHSSWVGKIELSMISLFVVHIELSVDSSNIAMVAQIGRLMGISNLGKFISHSWSPTKYSGTFEKVKKK